MQVHHTTNHYHIVPNIVFEILFPFYFDKYILFLTSTKTSTSSMHIISLTLTTAPNAFTVDQCPEYSIVLHVRAYLQSDKYVVWSSYTKYNRDQAVFLWKTQNVPNGGVPILCIFSFLYSFTFFIYIVYICFQDYIISFIVWKKLQDLCWIFIKLFKCKYYTL